MADLIPTTAHLPLPWIMGYDLEPLRTLESKRALLADAVRGGWRLVFEHDPDGGLAECRCSEGKGLEYCASDRCVGAPDARVRPRCSG